MPKMIVVEGLDGSGKETQTNLLKEALLAKGLSVESVSFPRYGETSAALVEEYLHGVFGDDPKVINAYGASSFFAMDRFASYLRGWKSTYESCDVFLADRYVTSNAIHQCSKLPEGEWEGYLDWLFDYEYVRLGLPKPDLVIYLHLDIDSNQMLLNKRYGRNDERKDIHELDVDYLHRSQVAAEYCAARCNWERIECMESGTLRSIESIHEEIVTRIDI